MKEWQRAKRDKKKDKTRDKKREKVSERERISEWKHICDIKGMNTALNI